MRDTIRTGNMAQKDPIGVESFGVSRKFLREAVI